MLESAARICGQNLRPESASRTCGQNLRPTSSISPCQALGSKGHNSQLSRFSRSLHLILQVSSVYWRSRKIWLEAWSVHTHAQVRSTYSCKGLSACRAFIRPRALHLCFCRNACHGASGPNPVPAATMAAPRPISQDEWNEHKAEIISLYPQTSRKELLKRLADTYNFHPTLVDPSLAASR